MIGKLETFSSDVSWLSSRFPELRPHLVALNETNASDYQHAGTRHCSSTFDTIVLHVKTE
jgi:hypothetical protein